MKRTLAILGASIFCFVGLGAHALAQVPDSERTLVTDPNVLASMGFPRDAKNVYIKNGVGDPSNVPNDFGPNAHFTAIQPKAFVGRYDQPGGSNSWEYSGGVEGCCANISRTGTETFMDAPMDLPTGVNIQAMRWWANDTNATNHMSIFVFQVCHPGFSPGPTVYTTIASASPATTGAGDESNVIPGSGGVTVDNQNCHYTARVRFDDVTGLTFQKLRVQWNRQVSPAPAVATFGDVPTSHPFFQFIEALAASGITAGCGGGNYCPNNPLTRGQMAVYLSIALGLNWP
ncbi:MAG: S-layer homology domain-containing protein [Thermoanaerobaculia bacterium]